jgi:hypothetical protein
LLYPDRQLPRFDEKNNIPTERIQSSKLLMKLVAEKDNAIVSMDDAGQCHFNGSFRNANLVNAALDKLDKHQYGELVKEEKGACARYLRGDVRPQVFYWEVRHFLCLRRPWQYLLAYGF